MLARVVGPVVAATGTASVVPGTVADTEAGGEGVPAASTTLDDCVTRAT